MIISHTHKFIFIKTRKTAGTSLEYALAKICGEGDIVTPILPQIEGHHPRNYDGFYNHIGATDIRKSITPAAWNSYFKFAFDRNPWDKVVSMYYWRKHLNKIDCDFNAFCRKADGYITGDYLMPSDYPRYVLDNKIAVDFLGKFETLNQDFQSICRQLGLPEMTLTREKSNIRDNSNHYSAYYDDETRQIVTRNFNREIDLFGYEFESRLTSVSR